MIDAPALVDEDLRREDAGERGGVNDLPQDLEYLQHMRAEQVASEYLPEYDLDFVRLITDGLYKDTPLILFTHIPLYRPSDSNCGPLHEKGIIPYVRGKGYQTRDLPTSPGRTQFYGHFQVFYTLLFLPFSNLFSPHHPRIADEILTVVMTTTIVNRQAGRSA